MTWCELKNLCKNGSGYYFKSKVSIAAKARNFTSMLVTSQWLKPKLANMTSILKVNHFKQIHDVQIKSHQRRQRKLHLPKCARQGK